MPITQLTISPALDIALMGAGGLMGIRSGVSLMIGAVLNYFILAPWMISLGQIVPKAGTTDVFGLRQITLWSLWPGVAGMVVASFVAFFAKPGTITSAFKGLTSKKTTDDALKDIEVPLWISLIGIPIMSVVAAVLSYQFFHVPSGLRWSGFH